MELLKMYDKKLSTKRHLDGSLEILRQSVFDSRRKHSIKIFYNQFVGSSKWIIETLKSMDSTRHDFFAPSIQKNNNLRKQKSDDRMHRDIAEFLRNGTQFVG